MEGSSVTGKVAARPYNGPAMAGHARRAWRSRHDFEDILLRAEKSDDENRLQFAMRVAPTCDISAMNRAPSTGNPLPSRLARRYHDDYEFRVLPAAAERPALPALCRAAFQWRHPPGSLSWLRYLDSHPDGDR